MNNLLPGWWISFPGPHAARQSAPLGARPHVLVSAQEACSGKKVDLPIQPALMGAKPAVDRFAS
jgi:hypothetical protein